MEKKLQKRFIFVAVLAIFILMTSIILPLNLGNFVAERQRENGILDYILENDGVMPERTDEETDSGEQAVSESGSDSIADSSSETAADGIASSSEPQPDAGFNLFGIHFDIFNTGKRSVSYEDLELTVESRYQLRYFSVLLKEDGSIEPVNFQHIASVSFEDSSQMVEKDLDKLRKKGRIYNDGSYYSYKMREQDDGSYLIVFLDCTQEINRLTHSQNMGVFFSVMVIIIYGLLLAFLSKRIMKPYFDNMERQKQFITNAGHELKTPLAVISANAEVLEMLNGENEWTTSIRSQVRRLTKLVQSLIALARSDEQTQATLTDVDFSAAAKESADSFRPVIEQGGKSLEVHIQDQIHVMADPNMLEEVVNILLDNASKYCDEKGLIRLELEEKRNIRGRKEAILTVSNDYAEGKDVDYSRFFDRFYRQDTSHNSNKKKGFGIGLSMAENLVTTCKGKITASWKNGRISFQVLF